MKLPTEWKQITLGEIFVFNKKSKIKAGEGKKDGKYKFFTSSEIQNKFIDKAIFDGESLIPLFFGETFSEKIAYTETANPLTDNTPPKPRTT